MHKRLLTTPGRFQSWCPHPSTFNQLPSLIYKYMTKYHQTYKAVLPLEKNTQLLPFASTVSTHNFASMTFRPKGLSRDPHGIGWKDSLPNQNGLSDPQLASNTLCDSQNGRSEPLPGLYTLGGSLNGLSVPQLASNALCGSQNGHSELLLGLYTLGSSLNRHSEPLHGLYTLCCSLNGLYKPLHASYKLCGNQNTLSEPLPAFYTLCGSQNGLSQLPHACYTLCGSQNRHS